MEYGALGFSVVVFCQDHLFLGIGAAYGSTVAVAPGITCLEPTHCATALSYVGASCRKDA